MSSMRFWAIVIQISNILFEGQAEKALVRENLGRKKFEGHPRRLDWIRVG